jgi:uncharacterized protein (UPF0147 family)
MAEVKTLMAQAATRLEAASATTIPRGARRAAQQALTGLQQTLQEADAAVQAEDYTAAEGLLTDARTRIQDVLATITPAPISQSPRRRE